jgi:hypothetical protein
MKKAFIFDFDDTLAKTDARVLVRANHGNNIVARLTPQEFNTHNLSANCHYDFCEFKKADYIHQADATFLMHLAREVFNEGHDVYILTAREFDVTDAIHTFMLANGIQPTFIHAVGGTNDISERKKKILLDIVERYDKIYFYDDSEENVNVYEHEKLRTYLWKMPC